MDLAEHGVGPDGRVGGSSEGGEDQFSIGIVVVSGGPVMMIGERARCKGKAVDGVFERRVGCEVVGEGTIVKYLLSELLGKEKGQAEGKQSRSSIDGGGGERGSFAGRKGIEVEHFARCGCTNVKTSKFGRVSDAEIVGEDGIVERRRGLGDGKCCVVYWDSA